MPFSRGASQPRDGTSISCIAGGFVIMEPPGKPVLVLLVGVLIITIQPAMCYYIPFQMGKKKFFKRLNDVL